jgi:four helix bundle protein
MYHFEKLEIWQKAMNMVENIYAATEFFPSKEKFALTDQLRRAAVSVPINIAEGTGRNSKKEFLQFLTITRGSLYETVTLLMIAKRLNYIGEEKHSELSTTIESINKMLSKLISSLRY